jgi:hypothetical protein
MFKKCFFSLYLVLCSFLLNAQERATEFYDEEGTNLNVLYRNDQSIKAFVNTRGFGLLFRRCKHQTIKTRSFYEFDIQSLNSLKEVSSEGIAETKNNFVFGKLNSVLLLRGALGIQNVIFSKASINAVEVRYSFSFGPTLAFAKPYYVKLEPLEPLDQPEFVKFDSEKYKTESIIGRGGLLYGMDEIVLYPALTAKFNLSFEYAPYTNLIRAIETGISIDYFPKALPIMAQNPAENLIVTFHVGLVFGKKWF